MSRFYGGLVGVIEDDGNHLKQLYTFTPKEGAGRSNRLGDANKNSHLRLIAGGFFICRLHIGCSNKDRASVHFSNLFKLFSS